MKLRYMPLIFTLILGLLNASASGSQAQAKLYQEIPRPRNLAPVYSLAFASSTDKPTYILGQMNYFLLTTGTQKHHRIRHPRYYIGSRTVCAAFSHALKYALGLSKGNLVLLYDALDDESWSSFSTDSTVNAVAFSPDSKIIAVGTAENVSFWNVQTKGKHLRQPKSPGATQALAFSPDGKILAIGKMLGTVELWDVNKNTNLTVLRPEVSSPHEIYALAFSPDGKTLAAGKAHNGEIDVWTVPHGKSLGSLKGHQTTATIRSVAFSPNNRTLASGATDGSVLFWDVQTQKKIDPIQHFTQKHPEFGGTGHGEKTEVLSVAFSNDGKTLMSGDATGLVLLWDLSKINTETDNRKTPHDMTPPTIALGPIPTVTAEARRVTLRGSTTSSIGIQENRIRITNNGKTLPSATLTANGKFAVSIPLNEGDNQIIFTAVDKNEQSTQNRVTLHRPLTPPEIEVIEPRLGVNNAADIPQPTQQIRVRITDTSAIARVTLNDTEMAPTLTRNVYALRSPRIVSQATFTLSAVDTHGSQNSEVFTLNYRQPDDTPPTLTIIQPVPDASNAATINTSPFPVTVEVTDESGIQDVRINGVKATALGENRFSRSISQNDSLNQVEIKATDTVGNTHSTSFRIVHQQKPPSDPDVSPTPAERNDPRLLFADSKLEDTRRKTSNQAVFTLEFIVLDESRIKEVTAKRSDDSATYPVSKSGKRDYTTHLQLKEGENRFEIQVTDEWNNIELETVTIIRVSADTEPPRFTVLDPIPAVNAQTRQVTLRGGVTSSIGIQENRIRITNNGKPQPSATLTANGRFTASIRLNEGNNQIIFTAVDKNKQSAQNGVTIYRPLIPPEIEVLQPRLDANNSAEVRESIQRIRVRVTDASEITQITLNGRKMAPTVTKDVYVLTSKPIVSQATFTVSAVDTHGSRNSKSFTLNYRQPDDTPPTLTIIQPVPDASNAATIAPLPFLVTVEVTDESGIQDVRINGIKAADLGNNTFNATVLYNANLSQVEIKATDTAGNTNTKSFRVVHQEKSLPDIPMEREDPRLLFTDSKLEDTRRQTSKMDIFTLEFIVLDESRIEEVTVKRSDDGAVYPVSKSGKRDYAAHLQLKTGDNRFEIRVADEWDNIEIETVTLTRIQADTEAPRFTSLSVGEGIQVQQIPVRGGYLAYNTPIVVANEGLVMRGRLTDESGISTVKVAVNDSAPEGLPLQDGTRFEKRLSLDYGQNQIYVTATDTQGNSDDTRFTIHQRPDRDGKDLALFFATDRYEGEKDTHGHWRDLTTAIADAEQVAKKLRDAYGFKTKVVKNPTGRALMETLITYQDRFIDENGAVFRYEDGTQLLIYFAGHGYYNKRTAAGYLVTRESEPPSIDPAQFTAVEHSSIRRSIDLIACNRVLVLMDTCFSGTFDPKYKPQTSAQLRSLVEDGTLLDQINMMLKLTARWCLTSASGEYVADTGGTNGHSPFAAAFMAALDTRGGPDALLKLDEIWDKIQDSKHADIYNELEQNPQRAGLQTFERPEPRKGQFGAKAELYEESDFLLFPTVVDP